MGGTTTKGLPFPTGTDRVMDGDDAIAALAQALDYTSCQILSGATFTAATPLANYPDGLSVINMSSGNAASGGWPEGGSALIFTVKQNDRAAQWWFRNNYVTSDIRYRILGTAGVGVWQHLAQPDTCSGKATLTPSAPDTAVGLAVTFPAGRFTVPPNITCQWGSAIGNNASQYQINWPSAITAAGFTLQVRRWSAVATLVFWTAHADEG